MTSRSRSLSRAASEVVVPGVTPASTRACLAQPRSLSGTTPTRGPIRSTAPFNDKFGSSAIASDTRRRARSRSSFGYFLGAGTRSLSRGLRPSTNPGALHTASSTARRPPRPATDLLSFRPSLPAQLSAVVDRPGEAPALPAANRATRIDSEHLDKRNLAVRGVHRLTEPGKQPGSDHPGKAPVAPSSSGKQSRRRAQLERHAGIPTPTISAGTTHTAGESDR